MKRSIVTGVLFGLCFCPDGGAGPRSANELAPKVRNIFETRCASCHGADLSRPKGKFGYVLDLRRVSHNPQMVVPGDPDASPLFQLIERNKMPPANPLSSGERDVVRSWIEAGAPLLSTADPPDGAGQGGSPFSDDVRWILDAVGRFHFLILHFPIAFLVAAGLVELAGARRTGAAPAPVVRAFVWWGAASALAAASLGWCYALAGHGTGAPATLLWHRWSGTATAAWSVAAALMVERDAQRGRRRSSTQLLVLFGAVLVAMAGYFGGLLVHGELFGDW